MSGIDLSSLLSTSSVLSTSDRAEVSTLRDLCNTYERLDLKLTLPEQESPERTHLFYRQDGLLMGYALLEAGDEEAELCGMVHPEYRLRGIGRALLAAACVDCRRRQVRDLLLICEDISTSGRAFLSFTGAAYSFTEHRLYFDPLRSADHDSSPAAEVTLHAAGTVELALLAPIIALAFGQDESRVITAMERDMADPGNRFYLATLDGEAVGGLKVWSAEPHSAYLYAVGVLPSHQRRGIGRAMLRKIVALLLQQGYQHIGLEVDDDNRAGLHLYQSSGFYVATSYGYYSYPI